MNRLVSIFYHTLIFVFIGLFACSARAYGQYSLYEDPKANQPGDVITVILAENISGSFNTNQTHNSATAGDASSTVQGSFIPIEPYFSAGAEVNYDSDQRIRANQSQLLQGTLSVMVEEVLPNRNLRIRGQRVTEINGETHELRLSGIVRPSDIDNLNRVYSFQIADAEIFYQKKGGIDKISRRPGFVGKIIFGAVGILAGTLAVLNAID